MHISIPLSVATLLAVGIIIIGSLYIASRAWLRLKGIRDIVSGLVVLTLIATTNPHTTGIAFLVESLTAFGDMSNVLGSGGSKQAAFSIHGATFAVMVVTGLFLIQVL
jgi:hypothetical protein